MEEKQQKLIRIDKQNIEEINKIFKEKGFKNFNEGINYLINKEIDNYRIGETEDTILRNVDDIFKSRLNMFEDEFSNRVLRLISNVAIELGIYNLLLSGSMEINEKEIQEIRRIVIENIKKNGNLFKYRIGN